MIARLIEWVECCTHKRGTGIESLSGTPYCLLNNHTSYAGIGYYTLYVTGEHFMYDVIGLRFAEEFIHNRHIQGVTE